VSARAGDLVELHAFGLPDVQAEQPAVALALDEAGISDLRYPISFDVGGQPQRTVATVALAASVADTVRGVHMSRFVEALHEWHDRLSVEGVLALLDDVLNRLGAETATVALDFPVFLERTAPVSAGAAFVPYDCRLQGEVSRASRSMTLTIRVPVTSLCPCSREISDYGAHNQRGTVEISVSLRLDGVDARVELGELIDLAEAAGSAPIYTALKRSDERFVTMNAYENPAFVEDMTRAVADALRRDERLLAGRVRVVNEESIHTHNAYASVAWHR
jgi:GTP cyclohydrolase FolE2